MIPKAITTALDALVRDRDRYKRLALDRAPVRSADRRREIEARDKAVERLLYGIWIEGLASHQSRGAVCALFDAIKLLRPDVAATMENGLDDAGHARRRFFPDPEDIA